ncbi:MAG: hypothetical protein JRC92_00510 [Deltaproteobacteria bacterium]|nr:hypothetical protein [Deltaproteobacteria bacterium]
MFRARLVLAILAALVLLASPVLAKREHVVHFQGTVYELHIFKIQGHKLGKTLMLIGGIQGNEPGGFLSADLYADMTLEKGSLIVVPRANFYSILLNQRGPNGDMNRKFDKRGESDYEAQIVEILKDLMAESDCLLNLHDGSGFYRPTYVNERMNPLRYGQSIIADADAYRPPQTGVVLELGRMARLVCAELNQAIDNPLYRFRFNDHRTLEPDSPHHEQRGSATFYALTRVGIPAFGIETSKNLPTIEMKVRHHKLAIDAFMRLLGIIPEHPPVNVESPELRYLVLSINGGRPQVVSNKETLSLKRGDNIFVSHIEANYERGLTVDILGLGGINDSRKGFEIQRPTSIVVRKDHQQCGWIRLTVRDEPEPQPTGSNASNASNAMVLYFVVQVNGERRLVATGQPLKMIKGDTLRLQEAWTASGQRAELALNFKGFVPPGQTNSGDDTAVLIRTDKEFMKKWALDEEGRRYRVVAEQGKLNFGEFYVQIDAPIMDYLIIQANHEAKYAVSPGETLLLDEEDSIRVVDIKANFDAASEVKLVLRGGGGEIDLGQGQGIRVKDLLDSGGESEDRLELIVLRRQTPVGRIYIMSRPVAAATSEADGAS